MHKDVLVGRKEERGILKKALRSSKAEMVAVIGRRRVGKTFLIKTVYDKHLDFELTGTQFASKKEQLRNFMIQLNKFSNGKFPSIPPKDWLEAFHLLSSFLEMKEKKEKMVIFLDELPWLSTHRSGFLKGLSYFWNSWAVNQKIVVVICGSAASWMIRKVIHHKGGLHNRITRRIALKPFTLAETEAFLVSKKIRLDRYQIVHLYMALGGVPHYLEAVEGGKSAAQNIDQICFSENGLLRDEFSKLFSALFDHPEAHIKVIRTLSRKRKGLTRGEIVSASKLPEGGGTSKVLEELLHSGFVSVDLPFGKKKKESLYRLSDEYSMFYLSFMENNKRMESGTWQKLSQTPSYKSWTGYTFEGICLKHIPQIKKALGITGVYVNASSYFKKGTKEEEGLQIDLLLDRNDQVINICEMKFYAAELMITKAQALELRNKVARFKTATKTRKQVFITLITTFGINENQHSQGLVDNTLSMDDLF